MIRADGAADWWCYSYRVLLKGLPTTTCYLSTRGDSHTNMPAYTNAALAWWECGAREALEDGGEDVVRRRWSNERRYQMLLNRGLLCRVWTFVSLVKFHHWVSSTLRYLISHPGLSLAGIPPGNLSRLAAKPNDRLIIYLCAYEGWTRCAASREEALTLFWGGGEALPIKEVRRDNFRICSRAPDTRRREM